VWPFGPGEAQRLHAALQLIGRSGGVLHGKMRKAAIARLLLYLLGEVVIGLLGELHGLGRIGFGLHAGSGDRQHGDLDAA